MRREVHSIERQSYLLLRSTVDTSRLPKHSRDVAERIVHTTADPQWLGDLVLDEAALAQAAQALENGAPLITDVVMVAAGITARESICYLSERRLWVPPGKTRSAAAFAHAATTHPAGAVWVVGNAPTALFELLSLASSGVVRPVLVIGLPVGFVGAAEAKRALRESGLPQLSNVSARGGSNVAAAAVNALLYGDPLEGEG
jgi:precorrin-8X/cobalt-precorrin-8 methylmutase